MIAFRWDSDVTAAYHSRRRGDYDYDTCQCTVTRSQVATQYSRITLIPQPTITRTLLACCRPVRVRFIRCSRKRHDRTPLDDQPLRSPREISRILALPTLPFAIECRCCFWGQVQHEPTTIRIPQPCLSRPSISVLVNRAMLDLGKCLRASVRTNNRIGERNLDFIWSVYIDFMQRWVVRSKDHMLSTDDYQVSEAVHCGT